MKMTGVKGNNSMYKLLEISHRVEILSN